MLSAASYPRLAAGVRLHHDTARQQWVLLAPERMVVLDDIAQIIVSRCSGHASVDEIAAALAAEFDAPVAVITQDVLSLLTTLAEKGCVRGA